VGELLGSTLQAGAGANFTRLSHLQRGDDQAAPLDLGHLRHVDHGAAKLAGKGDALVCAKACRCCGACRWWMEQGSRGLIIN
jgi:hypothetical protein